ncbi:MAG: protein adenylyltransferase SelO family protein, partial [Lysobacteraceae bacterium]
VGFVHGVMNTDNMSILGLTIDYGPYGWIDNYDPDWTPNTTDREHRRYRFGQQSQVAYWNLTRLASALALVLDHDALRDGLQRYAAVFAQCDRETIARKLGLAECRESDLALMQSVHGLMAAAEVDMTLFFRALVDIDPASPKLDLLHAAFYDQARFNSMGSDLIDWLRRYAARLQDDPLDADARSEKMRAANPKYVLRNYLAQQAIDLAEKGDASEILKLLELLRRPYDDQPENAHYATRRPDWARNRAGCSMLSCSS